MKPVTNTKPKVSASHVKTPTRTRVHDSLRDLRLATAEKLEEIRKIYAGDCGVGRDDLRETAKALFFVRFLMDFYTDSGDCENGVPKEVVFGFAKIIDQCAQQTFQIMEREKAAQALAVRLEERLEAAGL